MSYEYCELARERMARYESQPRLFNERSEIYLEEK